MVDILFSLQTWLIRHSCLTNYVSPLVTNNSVIQGLQCIVQYIKRSCLSCNINSEILFYIKIPLNIALELLKRLAICKFLPFPATKDLFPAFGLNSYQMFDGPQSQNIRQSDLAAYRHHVDVGGAINTHQHDARWASMMITAYRHQDNILFQYNAFSHYFNEFFLFSNQF